MKLWPGKRRERQDLPSFVKAVLTDLNSRLLLLASFLQQKTNFYSRKKKKALLFFFVILFVAGSGMVTWKSFTNRDLVTIAHERIQTIPFERGREEAPVVTQAEFQKMQKFKNWVDSLGTTEAGRKNKDLLFRLRPRLMDSVNFIINLYLEQLKTSANEK